MKKKTKWRKYSEHNKRLETWIKKVKCPNQYRNVISAVQSLIYTPCYAVQETTAFNQSEHISVQHVWLQTSALQATMTLEQWEHVGQH